MWLLAYNSCFALICGEAETSLAEIIA